MHNWGDMSTVAPAASVAAGQQLRFGGYRFSARAAMSLR